MTEIRYVNDKSLLRGNQKKKEKRMKSGEVMTILENALRIGKGVTRYGKVAAYIPEE